MRCSTPQTHPHPAMHPAQVPPRPRTAPDHRAAAATRAGTWIEHPIDAGSRMHPELYISSCTVNIPYIRWLALGVAFESVRPTLRITHAATRLVPQQT
jgi:hypothetical protein